MSPQPFVPAYANWRPEKQITDPKVFKGEAAQELREQPCACCTHRRGETLHHVLPRSQRGDDVIENLIGLCVHCHDLLHHGVRAKQLHRAIGQRLTVANIGYVIAKRSAAWLETRYGVILRQAGDG